MNIWKFTWQMFGLLTLRAILVGITLALTFLTIYGIYLGAGWMINGLLAVWSGVFGYWSYCLSWMVEAEEAFTRIEQGRPRP
jgi:hypothetical protein